MIKQLANCPSCNSVIAIDVIKSRIVHNPDGSPPIPCPHLACLWVDLEVWGRRDFEVGLHGESWLVEYGQQPREVKHSHGAGDIRLIDYLIDLAGNGLPQGLVPTAEHHVVGASAHGREDTRPGSGVFLVKRKGRRPQRARLDSWAVFGADPDRLMRELRELAMRRMTRVWDHVSEIPDPSDDDECMQAMIERIWCAAVQAVPMPGGIPRSALEAIKRQRMDMILQILGTSMADLRDRRTVLTETDMTEVGSVLARRGKDAAPWVCEVHRVNPQRFQAIMDYISSREELHTIGDSIKNDLGADSRPGW